MSYFLQGYYELCTLYSFVYIKKRIDFSFIIGLFVLTLERKGKGLENTYNIEIMRMRTNIKTGSSPKFSPDHSHHEQAEYIVGTFVM